MIIPRILCVGMGLGVVTARYVRRSTSCKRSLKVDNSPARLAGTVLLGHLRGPPGPSSSSHPVSKLSGVTCPRASLNSELPPSLTLNPSSMSSSSCLVCNSESSGCPNRRAAPPFPPSAPVTYSIPSSSTTASKVEWKLCCLLVSCCRSTDIGTCSPSVDSRTQRTLLAGPPEALMLQGMPCEPVDCGGDSTRTRRTVRQDVGTLGGARPCRS